MTLPVEKQIPIFRSHAMRRSFATRCFEAGVPPKVVQKYLGHTNIQTTMDIYTKVFDDVGPKMVEKISWQVVKGGQKVVRSLQCTGKLDLSKPSSASWITKAEVSTSGVLTIVVAENKETKERNAEITIQSEHYKSSDTHRKNYQTKFKVTQAAAEPEEEEK